MMTHPIEIPNGLIVDCYDIEEAPEGVWISHYIRDELGFEELTSRACLMVVPEAMGRIAEELRRRGHEFAGAAR